MLPLGSTGNYVIAKPVALTHDHRKKEGKCCVSAGVKERMSKQAASLYKAVVTPRGR
jgi:hypothetical protein